MDEFLRKVKSVIKGHNLLEAKARVIVAISGGADSVALLAALNALGYEAIAAHCNFHLRGEESMRDMRHVEAITSQLGVDLYVKDFDVDARRRATGESVEMACRELRYEWFYDLLDRSYCQAIAVGHHREDCVETFFLNLMRGTGLSGLAGMRYRHGSVIRPLLDVSRSEIEAYLERIGLEWITDSSNASNDYLRNRLRNRLLPLMQELFPGSFDAVLATAANLRETATFYDKAIAEAASRYCHDGEYNLAEMMAEPSAGLILFETLRREGFSRRQTDDMLVAATRSGGTFTAAQTHIRDVDHGMLRAPHAGAPVAVDAVEVSPTHNITMPLHIAVSRLPISDFAPTRDANTIYLDAEAVEGCHRWIIRPWCRGDRMQPYGMAGKKLLSDIFADAKLSAAQKRQIRVLTCDDEIIWAIGLRASARYAVTASTAQFIKLQYLPEK
jgi:tRNA(Ile)-lysidine synthase